MRCRVRTPGSAAYGAQSNAGSLGSSAAVARPTRPVIRSIAVASRRAPMNAERTTPPPTATNATSSRLRNP